VSGEPAEKGREDDIPRLLESNRREGRLATFVEMPPYDRL
jgi:hypothetical protein